MIRRWRIRRMEREALRDQMRWLMVPGSGTVVFLKLLAIHVEEASGATSLRDFSA